MRRAKAIVLLSGGLDSLTAAARAATDGYDLIARQLTTVSTMFERSSPLDNVQAFGD